MKPLITFVITNHLQNVLVNGILEIHLTFASQLMIKIIE